MAHTCDWCVRAACLNKLSQVLIVRKLLLFRLSDDKNDMKNSHQKIEKFRSGVSQLTEMAQQLRTIACLLKYVRRMQKWHGKQI